MCLLDVRKKGHMHLASILSVKKRQKCNKEGGMGREDFISYRSHNSKQKDEQRCLGYRSFKGNIIKKKHDKRNSKW